MSKISDNKRDHYVSRGALKLKHAIERFGLNIKDKVVADLGCSTGGFVEVLLEEGAKKIYALDTAYGQLDWKLRKDERVVVMERTNALHAELPEKVDLITIDVGWTRQKLVIPRALKLLKPNGQIVSLVKPHYEAKNYGLKFKGGKLAESESREVLQLVMDDLKDLNIKIKQYIKSPVSGEKGKNTEYFIWIKAKAKQ